MSEHIEKVIESEADLDWLINNPSAYKNAVCIIEPASNVGQNYAREDVRASSNIAYLCRVIADCDSILFPLWKLGKLDQKKLDHIFETCLAVFVEGGYPSAKDPESFAGQSISLQGLQSVIENLISPARQIYFPDPYVRYRFLKGMRALLALR